jgi:hypothetical protein
MAFPERRGAKAERVARTGRFWGPTKKDEAR